MEYKINENECLRRDELPRLIRDAVNSYSSGGLNQLLVGDDLKNPKPIYPKNHKETRIELEKDKDFLNNKKRISSKKKGDLIREYNEDSEIRSLVALRFICEKCSQNSQCSNYQDYQMSNSD